MKHDRITKLYEGLNNRERAALSLSYLIGGDELELGRVIAAVPVKTYRCLDFEYRQWLDSFFSLASLWTGEHWRTRTRLMAALAAFHIHHARKEADKVADMLMLFERLESRLLALDRALLAICQEHGIDPEAVREYAGAEPFVPCYGERKLDVEYQEIIQVNLTRALKAWQC